MAGAWVVAEESGFRYTKGNERNPLLRLGT